VTLELAPRARSASFACRSRRDGGTVPRRHPLGRAAAGRRPQRRIFRLPGGLIS
jgi:hypothetical protein